MKKKQTFFAGRAVFYFNNMFNLSQISTSFLTIYYSYCKPTYFNTTYLSLILNTKNIITFSIQNNNKFKLENDFKL